MNPINLIEKLINEHGSSTILKERLELLRDQISILEKENGALKSKNAILKEKVNTIKSQLNEATEEIERLNHIIEGFKKDDAKKHFDEVTEKILKLFFDTGRDLSADDVAHYFSMDISTTNYHFDLLLERNLIKIKIQMSLYRVSGRSKRFQITSDGRKYVIENILPKRPA